MAIRRPMIVLLGMASKMPAAGVVWQTMHYVLGFERLGYEVCYVEAHARTPTTLMIHEDDDSSALAVDFIRGMLRRFGFSGRWAYHALHDDGRCYGMSLEELHRTYRSADLLINLHGGTKPLPEHAATERLVYLETDPVRVQVELSENDPDAIDYLAPHVAFFTFAENYGRPGCGLPVTSRFEFRPTRQPVLVDLWERQGPPSGEAFRTIGNWRQDWLDVALDGEVYGWSKHLEFLKFVDLPRRTGARFEPALSKVDAEHLALLRQNGWDVLDALRFGQDPDEYRRFIHGSLGEFSVAKDQNVRLRSGWFSDRSATFLASGLPVVVQDTAFDCALPTGEGLLGFRTTDEAVEAVERVRAEPARHARAAREIAEEYLSHEVVLGRLLADLGMPSRLNAARPARAPRPALPPSLVLTPISRHPTELDPGTVETALRRPIPQPSGVDGAPVASVVVVTHDNLPCTRMCLESVLAGDAAVELIVIDNASAPETQAYLSDLRSLHPSVRVVFNRQNRSFAAAVNQGLALAAAPMLVILNNDTIVTPGWLKGLAHHLEDPAVGLVGAVTNEAGNEARIEVSYRTYGELLDFAGGRAAERAGLAFDIPVATMFCTAMTRASYELLGPLDERYAVGLFEDDDYSLRATTVGLRVICAEDVFVHHFGKSTFGSLVPTGDYAALFEANRRRFETKWGCEWKPHSRRPSVAWEQLVEDVRGLVAETTPEDAIVLVVSRGDDALLDLGGRTGWHFPRDAAGEHAGYYPADSEEAIGHLEQLRLEGATHLVIPTMELWWLDHYEALNDHLEGDHRVVARTSAGVAYRLLAEREPRFVLAGAQRAAR